MKRTIIAGLSTVALGTALLTPFTQATANGNKVTICHATGSLTNPYVQTTVSINAIGGHFENPGTPLAGHEQDLLIGVTPEVPEETKEPKPDKPKKDKPKPKPNKPESKPKPKPAPIIASSIQCINNTWVTTVTKNGQVISVTEAGTCQVTPANSQPITGYGETG